MLGITFGNKHSYDDWGVILEDTHINPPLPKRYLVDVPARNGLLDLTPELTPTIRFESRTLTFTFRVKAGDWSTLLSEIYGEIHGRTMDVTSDLDPDWHWHGCVTVDDFSSDERTGVLVISVDADPFKLSNTENTYTVNGNGSVTCTVDRMEVSPSFEITAPTTVIYNNTSTAVTSYRTKSASASGRLISFGDGTRNPATRLVANIDAVQQGEGDPSPTNIRPIIGFINPRVWTLGKNMMPVGNPRTVTVSEGLTCTIDADGGIHASGTNSTGAQQQYNLAYIGVGVRGLPTGVPLKLALDKSNGITVAVCYANKEGVTQNLIAQYNAGVCSFTVPENAVTVWTRVYFRAGNTYDDTNVIHPMIVNASESDYTFERFANNGTDIRLPVTCYGGTLDILKGILTVTHKGIDITALDWVFGGGTFYCTGNDRMYGNAASGIIGLCSAYTFYGNANSTTLINTMPDKQFGFQVTNGIIRIKDSNYTTVEDFKDAMAGQIMVYPLATPQTYQVTPIEIRTITGKNNIWFSGGESELTYIAQDYTDQKFQIAGLEMTQGANTLQIQSTGTTKITYRNGRL